MLCCGISPSISGCSHQLRRGNYSFEPSSLGGVLYVLAEKESSNPVSQIYAVISGIGRRRSTFTSKGGTHDKDHIRFLLRRTSLCLHLRKCMPSTSIVQVLINPQASSVLQSLVPLMDTRAVRGAQYPSVM